MRIILLLGLSYAFLLPATFVTVPKDEHKTLEIGASAPDFKLVGVDGKLTVLLPLKTRRFLLLFLPVIIVRLHRHMKIVLSK